MKNLNTLAAPAGIALLAVACVVMAFTLDSYSLLVFTLCALAAVVGVGLSCRLCERADCRHRAHPPLEHRLLLDPSVKGAAAYRFQPPARSEPAR